MADPTEYEIMKVLAHLLLQPHHDANSPIHRVYGPWVYSFPNMKEINGRNPPCEHWDRRNLKLGGGISVYRNRPTYWEERNASWEAWDASLDAETKARMEAGQWHPDDRDPLFLPDELGKDNHGVVEGSEVFWVCWHNFRSQGVYTPGKIPRIPAASVAEAMRAAEAALSKAGGWLCEEV